MHLVFRLTSQSVRFGLFTPEGDTINIWEFGVNNWSSRGLNHIFDANVIPELRGHGKIVTKIALIFPIASPSQVKPELAGKSLPTRKNRDSLMTGLNSRYECLLTLCRRTWPHVPCFWLFDSFMSPRISRLSVIPPLTHDATKQFNVSPILLESYAHQSNCVHADTSRPFISLVVEDVTSVALFHRDEIIDTVPTFSYWPSLMGLFQGGAFDFGLTSRLHEVIRSDRWNDFVADTQGLHSLADLAIDFEKIINLSGLIPRTKRDDVADVSIETLEYLEVSVRSFVKSIRSAIAGMLLSSLEARTIVVSSGYLSEQSGLWPLLTQGGLSHLTIKYNSTSSLASAARDLS